MLEKFHAVMIVYNKGGVVSGVQCERMFKEDK